MPSPAGEARNLDRNPTAPLDPWSNQLQVGNGVAMLQSNLVGNTRAEAHHDREVAPPPQPDAR